MKVNVTQEHIDNDTDEAPAIVKAIADTLRKDYPDCQVEMILWDIAVRLHPNEDAKKVYPLKGKALEFEKDMVRRRGVKPIEFEFNMDKLAKIPF